MEILLEKVLPEEKTSELTATAADLELQLELASLISEVTYRVRHHRVERELFFDGDVIFRLKFTCARCLDEFERDFSVRLALVLQLVPEDQVETVAETDDEFLLFPESSQTYSFDRHIRDLVSLEVPMKPLCREECAGLCPQCGAHLNREKCDCRREEIDPRWQKLRQFSNNN
jgi:uncharacterized protein